MINPCPDANPRLCSDYKSRKKLYDLLVHGGYISVMGESECKSADGDRMIDVAKEMIIEHNRKCLFTSNCRNINNCTSAIEEDSPLKLPKGFFKLDIPPRTLRSYALDIMKRVFGKTG